MNRRVLKYKSLLKIVLVTIYLLNACFAFESQMFQNINFFDTKYIDNYFDYNIYDISGNPALYHTSFIYNINQYSSFGKKQINSNHRYFEANRIESRGFDLFWIRQLDKATTLATGARYTHEYYMNVENSLEKDFYTNYFSFSDTTDGDITYQGPEIWLDFSKQISNNILMGVEINYGVERGLKDVFTECETIIRNMDATIGLGYESDSKNTLLGVSFKYLNRFSKYEAVKKQTDALTNIWYGYHLYYVENPRSTTRKNDDQNGYKISFQWEQKNLFTEGLGIRLTANYGELSNNIKVGEVKDLHKRGYWQRSAYEIVGNIFYNSELLNTQFYVVNMNNDDWASPHNYDALAIKKNDNVLRVGSVIDFQISEYIKLNGGFEISAILTDYYEYNVIFESEEDRVNNYYQLGTDLKVNQISSIYLTGSYQQIEPDFTWENVENFDIRGIRAGYKRQFEFGQIDIGLNYKSIILDQDDDNPNEEFCIDFILQR